MKKKAVVQSSQRVNGYAELSWRGFEKLVIVECREFGCISVKSDNEHALTSLVESRSNVQAARGASRKIVRNSTVGSSRSNGNSGRNHRVARQP